jgi:hypothetical protein
LAVVVGGCGGAFPAAATVLLPVCFAPLAGALVMLAAVRGLALPWAAAGLALAGNVLLGFAAACVVRTRTAEAAASGHMVMRGEGHTA